MGYKCTFMDNDTYTAQDVNDAMSHLTYEGVAIFEDSGDCLQDLNDAAQNITDSGVQYCSCKVVKSGNNYVISKGTCFMGDGSQITFDEDGFVVTPLENTKSYIYIERDILHNTIKVTVSAEPGGSATVPLAEINADGTISDKRKFAYSKVLPSGGNIRLNHHIEFRNMQYDQEYRFNVGWAGFHYLIFKDDSFSGKIPCYELSDGKICQMNTRNNQNTSAFIMAKKEGSEIVFYVVQGSSSSVDIQVEVV